MCMQSSFDDVKELCELPCIDDFTAIYDRCNFSPNPVAVRKSINLYRLIIIQQNLYFPTPFFFLKHVPIYLREESIIEGLLAADHNHNYTCTALLVYYWLMKKPLRMSQISRN